MFSQTEFVNLTISFRLFSKRLQAILTCSARRKLQENSNGCKLLGKVLATDSLQAWPWQNRRKPDTSGHQIRSERTCVSHVFPMFSPEEVFWQVLRERIMAALTQVECSETGDKAEWPVMASLYLWKSVRKWEVIDQIMK
jgi:hypothetical protein